MNIFQRRAAEFGAEFVDLTTVKFTPDLLRCIPAEVARQYRALPVSVSGNSLAVAVSDPSDIRAVDGLHSTLNREIELRIADLSQIDSFIARLY